jgi:hypothetical protein
MLLGRYSTVNREGSMSHTNPLLLNEQKRFFAVWYGLSEDQKKSLYKAYQRKHSLFVLWALEEIPLDQKMPGPEEKIHLLLAYKYLDWVWFTVLPQSEDEPFTIYIFDDIPEDQGPDEVSDAFDTSAEELQRHCKGIEKPEWAKKKSTKRVRVTIQSFPYQA